MRMSVSLSQPCRSAEEDCKLLGGNVISDSLWQHSHQAGGTSQRLTDLWRCSESAPAGRRQIHSSNSHQAGTWQWSCCYTLPAPPAALIHLSVLQHDNPTHGAASHSLSRRTHKCAHQQHYCSTGTGAFITGWVGGKKAITAEVTSVQHVRMLPQSLLSLRNAYNTAAPLLLHRHDADASCRFGPSLVWLYCCTTVN